MDKGMGIYLNSPQIGASSQFSILCIPKQYLAPLFGDIDPEKNNSL